MDESAADVVPTDEVPKTLEYRGDDYTVRLTCDSAASIPDTAVLAASEIPFGSAEYEAYLAQARAVLGLSEDKEIPKEYARFFDIKIIDGETEIEPAGPVKVEIIYDKAVEVKNPEAATLDVLHFDEKNDEVQKMTLEIADAAITVDTTTVVDAVSADALEDPEEFVVMDTFTAGVALPVENQAANQAETQSMAQVETEPTASDGMESADPAETLPKTPADTQTAALAETQPITSAETQTAVPSEMQDAVPSAVTFISDSFSVYGVIYNVAFITLEGGKYEVLGGKTVLLSDLLAALYPDSEEYRIDAVKNVSTSIDSLGILSVVPVDGDWEITTNTSADADTPEGLKLLVTFSNDVILSFDVAIIGTPEVSSDNVTIASADGSFLPEEAVASATPLGEEEAQSALDKVAPLAVTVEEGKTTEYKVFDISLDNVDADDYENGFTVDLNLDEIIEGRDFHLYHVHQNEEEIVTEDITESLILNDSVDNAGIESVNKLSFITSNFSEFVLSYTVDFEYNDYFYKLPGGGEMMLSELVEALGIAGDGQKYTSGSAFVADVLDAEFSNPDLVEVTKAGFFGLFSDDWILKTKESFVTEETLTITMKDSSRYVIKVTDPVESTNLSDFLKNVVIAGAVQDSTGAYIVEKGVHYNLIATFTEDSAYQFKNDGTLIYQMPDGVEVLAEQTGTMNINVVYKGKTYQVEADYHLGTDGRLEIEFDQSDTDYHRLAASTNVSFRFIFDAVFDGDTTRIKFSDNVERDIVFEEPKGGQAYATKSAEYDERTGIFRYTITVTADGDCTNINVRDVISGNAVIFNNDVQVSGNSSSYTDNWAPNGFDYTFASMADGEEITIMYTGRADFSKDMDNDGKLTVDQTKNTVTAQPEGGDPHKGEYSREIRYKWTTKSNGTEAGLTESGDKIIEWTIDYNELSLASVKGDTITDTISADSTDYMKYYGTEITVNVYDHSGNLVETRQVPYTSLTSHSDSSWTYTIPETDTEPYHYQIVYQTVVDMEKVNGGGTVVTLNNTANGDGGKIEVTPTNLVDITKDVESFTTEEINWVATLSVPEGGLTQAVVVDTLPVLYWHGKNIYDLYKEGSLDISGYLDGESYEVSYETGKVTITFYKGEGADKTTGLLGVPGGHTITIRLTTTVDQEWLAVGYDGGETEPGWARRLMDHQNSISIGTHTATATVTFDKPDIEKTAEVYKDEQGKVTSILYTLTLSGVSDVPVNIEDTFDTSLLEIDTSKTGFWFHMNLWGGNQYYQDAGPIPVSYADTSNGVLITANTVPMQANGNYYSHYKIMYFVKLKDGVDLDALAIANGGEHELTNTAKWGDHESSYTYKTVYDYFDKKLLNENELGGTNRTARYQISFNPAKAMLNQGEPMTLTDVMSSSLSLDYSSVSITTDPEGMPVPYSATGRDDGSTVVKYTIPDSTAVTITYEAMVVGNGPVTITNDADINGKEEHKESTKIYGGAGEGDAAVASFKIVKVDGYDASKKLEGVQFRLFAENPDLSFDSEGTKELILTSDENGEVIIDGDVFEIFFNEVYHLQEIEPLDGYGTISFDYLITLVSDMSLVDYNHYVYYYSDSMQIKNCPLEGLVVEKNVESTDEADLKANYHFKISILDDNGEVDISYNEKKGDDRFENGVFEFILKNREQKMFWGFERGTRYRVEEILTDEEGNEFTTTVGYDTFDEDGNVVEHMTETGRSHTGELTQETETIVFTNKKATKIGFEKIWMNNNASTKWAEDTSITVTVSGGDKTYTYTISRRDLTVGNEISGKKGDPKLTVRTVREDDQTKTYKYQFEVKGLPYNNGVSYKVTERKVDKYKDPVYKAGEVDTPDGAMDGGAIINIAEESYRLPETGGIGTVGFYVIGGAVLALGAGVLLWRRRRTI